MTPVKRWMSLILLLCVVVIPLTAEDSSRLDWWRSCIRLDHSDEFEYRHTRAPSARTEAQLRVLYENPTVIRSHAKPTNEKGATLETLTETHAVYPIAPEDILETLQDDDALTSFVPNLGDHEVVCKFSENYFRQRQRTDVHVLFFRLSSEYVIDVEYSSPKPRTYASRWVMVESLDNQIAYIYGSWFFQAVELDGRTVTYVRHYARSGLTTAVPGARLVIGGRIENEITNLLTAFYRETVRRNRGVAVR
jgi:hypothetical protein